MSKSLGNVINPMDVIHGISLQASHLSYHTMSFAEYYTISVRYKTELSEMLSHVGEAWIVCLIKHSAFSPGISHCLNMSLLGSLVVVSDFSWAFLHVFLPMLNCSYPTLSWAYLDVIDGIQILVRKNQSL